MEKVRESHGIWRAQKNTNPVNYMCSVVLIIAGKDLPVPISRAQNVSCWNGKTTGAPPPPPPPPPISLSQGLDDGTPPSLRVWISLCNTQNNSRWMSFNKEIGDNISPLFTHFSLPFPAVGSECHLFWPFGGWQVLWLNVDIYCILTSANFQKRNWGCSLCLCREYNVHVYKAISRKVVANSVRDNPGRYCR